MKVALSCLPAFVVLALGLVAGISGPLRPARSQGVVPHRICDWQSASFKKNLSPSIADIWTTLVCDGGGFDGCYVELVWGTYVRDSAMGGWVEMGWESSGRIGPHCDQAPLKHRSWTDRRYLPRGVECCLSVTAYNRTHSTPEPLGTSFLYWTN